MKPGSKFLKLTTIVSVCVLLTSCSAYYNITNMDDVVNDIGYSSGKLPFNLHSTDLDAPFLKEKGDVYLNTSFSNRFGVGAAIAVSDHSYISSRLGLYHKNIDGPDGSTYVEASYEEYDWWTNSSYFHDTAGYSDFEKDLLLTSLYFNLGYGWYQKLEKDFMNEISFGGGFGNIRNEYIYNSDIGEISFTEKRNNFLLYLQDDIGYVKDNFEASFTGRFNSYFFTSRSFEMAYDHDVPDYSNKAFTIEGSFRVAAGWKYIKPYAEVTGTLPIASPEIEIRPVAFKVGIITKF